MNPGIYLLHKPIGPTSFSVVKAFKAGGAEGVEIGQIAELGVIVPRNAGAGPPEIARPQVRPDASAASGLKICHGGTLDPFASGLLLMLVEPATRLFDYLHDIPKTYEATVRWGIETDNGDPFGKVISSGDCSELSERRLDEALSGFVGWSEQTPHATSARRIDGERAYLKAHRGESVAMPMARVYLHEARWLGHDLSGQDLSGRYLSGVDRPVQSRLRITVRGGFYVRALARDLSSFFCCW